MKKKIILYLFIIVVLSIGTTFAYLMTTFKTNELTIEVGTQDVGSGILVDLQPGYVLIPLDAVVTQSNETKMLEYHLTVQSDTVRQYTIEHNLPLAFNLVHNNLQTTFTTGTTYTITVTMNETVQVDQVFYITVKLL